MQRRIAQASLGGILLTTLIATSAQAQVVPSLVQRKDSVVTNPWGVEDKANTPPGGFSYEINGAQDFTYDSNALRTTTNSTSIYGSTTAPELVLRSKTPTSLVESTSRVEANVYNRSAFDSVDLHENLLLKTSNERWTASLRALFDRDTTRQSEIVSYGVTDPRVYSNRSEIRPSIVFKQNERDSWELNGSASNDSYSKSSYTDYNFYTLAPTYQHAFDMHNTGRISLNAQRYETASGADSSSNSYGPSIGWTNKFSPRLTLHGDAGAVVTEKDGAGNTADDGKWDYVFSAGVTYNGISNHMDFTALRAQEPFGNGTETLLTSFVVKGDHSINEKLSVNGTGIYREADYPSNQTGINLDHEYSLGAGLDYKFLREASLTANYTYHDETLINQPGTVNEHVVLVGVAFHPSWSPR